MFAVSLVLSILFVCFAFVDFFVTVYIYFFKDVLNVNIAFYRIANQYVKNLERSHKICHLLQSLFAL